MPRFPGLHCHKEDEVLHHFFVFFSSLTSAALNLSCFGDLWAAVLKVKACISTC